MREVFTYGIRGFRNFFRENLVALLYTLIFHLVILITLVLVRVEGLKKDQELGIRLEYEEKSVDEILQEEEVTLPKEWLQQVMKEREMASNRAVNLNAENQLTEDISTDEYVQELLKQIEEARNQEDREKLEELQAILASADYVPPQPDSDQHSKGEYTGPTTITYEFMDEPVQRKEVHLTIPVYRCQGSGVVSVLVEVGREGSVLHAEVEEPILGNDRTCFAEAALNAARSSSFRIELNGPERQRARITYTFIAQ